MRPTTKKLEMVPELAEAFAEILDEIWGKPWLGNATTRELLDEVAARVDLDYKTVGGEIKKDSPAGIFLTNLLNAGK